jgi:integrase
MSSPSFIEHFEEVRVESARRLQAQTAKNLHALGVDDKTIQAILRHEDVGTTQKSYILTLPETVTQAMARVGRKLGPCAAPVWQIRASTMVN